MALIVFILESHADQYFIVLYRYGLIKNCVATECKGAADVYLSQIPPTRFSLLIVE